MIAIGVWVRTTAGEPRKAGEARVAEPDPNRLGMLRGKFRSDTDYLAHPAAIALDLIQARLQP